MVRSDSFSHEVSSVPMIFPANRPLTQFHRGAVVGNRWPIAANNAYPAERCRSSARHPGSINRGWNQWIHLGEYLQETMDSPNMGGFL